MSARAADPARSQPLQSAVQWALLGLVIERPSYGYELATRFERAYGEALRLSSVSYAYTALQALEQRSLIEEISRSAGGRQPKPVYHATPKGVEAFQEQLVCEVSEERRRSRVSARKLAVFAAEPELALDLIARIREACLKEAVRSYRPNVAGPELDTVGDLAARLAAEEDRLAIEAKLTWLDYAVRELRALADRPALR